VGSLSDNGGNWPPEGNPHDGLPGLPEEWGVIVVPDDLSELTDEVNAVRAELRREQTRNRWQRFTDRPAVRRLRRVAAAAVRAPVLIISMAVLVTVASLFASAWQGPARAPVTQRTGNPTDDGTDTLPALQLLGSDGKLVPLRGLVPAVLLLTDGCECARFVADTVTAVRPEVAVLTVTAVQPSAPAGRTPATGAAPQAQGKIVRELRDPTDELRKNLDLRAPDGKAAAVLVDGAGGILHTVPSTTSVADLSPYLDRL
jgi:hypothetical protein